MKDEKSRGGVKVHLPILENVSEFILLMFVGILGALIGSFGNVVIYRLPLGKSVVYPGSSCPNCAHQIKPWENIPIVSWLALGGKCSSCKIPISARYPFIEALTAAGFVFLALRWNPLDYGATVVPLLIIYAMLVMMSLIDIDHYILPDSLTLPAIVVGLIGTYVYTANSGLPTLAEAATGGAIGAGIIALINRVGSLVVRRFVDTKERLHPIGMDQVNVAAVAGALGGWVWGVGAALVSVIVNLIARKPVRLPELPLYGLWVVALVVGTLGVFTTPVGAIAGTFAAAGVVSIVGAVYWWLREVFLGEPEPDIEEEDAEPVAMGFGDVKLAAILGVVLGWQSLLIALMAAFILGAVGGIIMRFIDGNKLVPFGPYLALGGMIALFFGVDIVAWYLGMLGI